MLVFVYNGINSGKLLSDCDCPQIFFSIMEEIKSNIEKIFAQYTDSITHAVPKRLSFTVNDSFETNG